MQLYGFSTRTIMRKFLFSLLLAAIPFVAKAQVFDTMRVQGAVLSSPFDKSPKYVDTLVLVLLDIHDMARLTTRPISEVITKYAQIMGVEPTELKNEKIYEFVDDWIGTPYRYGGESKKGVDCSALTRALYNFVTDLLLPRSSREMYSSKMVESFKEKDFSNLREGDLLFFRSRGRINHVAVYLCDGKFLSANRSTGVQISDLNDPYWRNRYYSAGRVKDVDLENDGGQAGVN